VFTLIQNLTAAGNTITFSVFAKTAQRSAIYLRLYNNTNVWEVAVFDLNAGTNPQNASGSATTFTNRTQAITPFGGGWNLCSITATFPASAVACCVHISNVSSGITFDASGDYAYAGNSANGVYLWGAAGYRSDLGGMQPNTSAYPMYNPTTPKNLLGYTESFDNAGWAKGGTLAFGSGSVANAILAPNGLQTADLLVETTGTVTPQAYQSTSAVVSGTIVTLSVYAKYAGRVLQLAFGTSDVTGNPRANFDLQNGILGSSDAGVTPSITPMGNGWYRCAVVATSAVSSGFDCTINLVNSTTAARNASYTGDGTSGIYLWGAQLSDSASLDSYSPVYGAAVTSAAYYGPRRDFDGATLACKGLLVEEQRSNLLLYSNTFTNGAWSPNGIASTTADVTGPDGVANSAFTITDSNTGNLGYRLQTVTVPNNSLAYTGSVYVKKTTGASTFPGVGFLYSGGTTVSAEYTLNTDTGVAVARIGNAGTSSAVVQNDGGFWRIEITATNNNTGNTSAALFVAPAVNSDGSGTWSAATIGSAVFYGAQLEVGASNAAAPFATSYIPTGSASATRNADVASVSTQAFPYSANEGTLVANGSPLSSVANTTQVIAELGDAGATNIFEIYRVSGGTNGALYVASGGVGSTITVSNAFPANAASKFGGVYKVNDFQAAANGTLGTPVTSGAVPTAASNLYIGKYGGATNVMWNGHIRQITYLPRRITNAELQTRTT
jgi:hypothetical protein